MGIYIRCTKCKSDYKLGVTFCKKCGNNIGGYKKYKVAVKTPEGRRIVRLVDNLTLAKRVENSIKGKIAEKKILGVVAAPSIVVVWSQYLDWAKRNKKSWDSDKSRWKLHVEPFIKNRNMDGVTRADVEKILVRMETKGGREGNGCSKATIKQVAVLINRVYNWAKEHDLYYGVNPASNIKISMPDNKVTECLTKDELERLKNTLDTWNNRMAALFTYFALYTGLRRGDIMNLEWGHVDMKKGFMSIRDPKGKPIILPISKKALEVLEQVREISTHPESKYVFHNRFGEKRVNFTHIWYRIRENAKLPAGFRFHGLRHTFASYLASSGEVDLYTLQKLLNHQSPEMTQRYAHLLDEALRRGANVADKVFSGNRKPSTHSD
jgi:integrase